MDEERLRPIDIGGSADSLSHRDVRLSKQLRRVWFELGVITRQRPIRVQQSQQSQVARLIVAER